MPPSLGTLKNFLRELSFNVSIRYSKVCPGEKKLQSLNTVTKYLIQSIYTWKSTSSSNRILCQDKNVLLFAWFNQPHVIIQLLKCATVTEKLNFYCILISFNLNSHMWLVSTALDNPVLNHDSYGVKTGNRIIAETC